MVAAVAAMIGTPLGAFLRTLQHQTCSCMHACLSVLAGISRGPDMWEIMHTPCCLCCCLLLLSQAAGRVGGGGGSAADSL